MSKRKNSHLVVLLLTVVMGFVALGIIVYEASKNSDYILLNPKGLIANDQTRLLVESTAIMVIVAIPVLTMLYAFAWKYREDNHKSEYRSESKHRRSMTIATWAVPIVTVGILVSMMIPATHKLVPQKNIEAEKDVMKIQVIGLRWKWLFIYPEQNVATVNFVQIPEDTPIEFLLTVDETPMSSFWIPHLGGQLYAMTEHVNRLNLIGEEPGDYIGKTAEINGAGFAGMQFTTRVSSQDDFDAWIASVSRQPEQLDDEAYEALLKPSEYHEVAYYSNPGAERFNEVVSKYGEHVHGGEDLMYEQYHGGEGH